MRNAALIGAILLIIFALMQENPDQVASSAPMFDIRKVEVIGDLHFADRENLQKSYNRLIGLGLFSEPMSALKYAAEQPAWIESVKIRRVWPHTLRIEVTEHSPVAFWNDRKIITTEGKVIAPQSIVELPLTHLSGPAETEGAVLDQFTLISQMLSTTSLRVAKLELEDRGAWNIWFTNGIAVRLGRDDVLERLQRFVAVYKSDLSGRIDRISSVDARYPHGVAVKWLAEE
ncbi:cell division protein FtsQ/DivIB [Marinomonas ostreistagni]|uniref:Cell division protein FtsQ n=1 Tax=Marinomonas ostreistagni TaxID=359209 RepID=A0ABS0ZDS0_9GAMM|nr:cell division protein FtsQ/DivIB [Marinomonas ostreistagni]MBJ7551821.1 cell division protein FtsQ/DivIB [Marinomonas ostreistagni]